MSESPSASTGPPVYTLKLEGHLDRTWAESFTDFVLSHALEPDGSPVTYLRGPVPDEAALHGYLARIRDLGIPLLMVEREL